MNVYVVAALGGIESKMLTAGVAVEPRNLRGVSSAEKARSVWARLRDRGRRPDEVLAAILGVSMCYSADLQRAKPEHRRVQIGKALSRMGGGQVKRWADPVSREAGELVLRWFPSSEGLVLRKLGEEAERIAEFLIHDHMDELLEFGAQQRHEQVMRSLQFMGAADV